MQKSILLLICFFAFFTSYCQQKEVNILLPDSTKKFMLVDAACGECQFEMQGSGCDLAIRINDKSYFVDGTNINDHGNAHAKDGFCNAIRKATVQGVIKDKRFKVTYFKLTPP